MNILERKRAISFIRLSERDVIEAKRYLRYFVDSYVEGERSCMYCFTRDRHSSDKIKNVIVKYFRYMSIDCAVRYEKRGCYWSLSLHYGEL